MATETTVFDLLVIGAVFVSSLLTLAAGYRVLRGPTVPDRVVALDTISTNFVAIAALVALYTGSGFYVSVALVLAIIGFVSTVSVAKYVVEERVIE
ncbi:MAG: monovalent cation/H+ antiporter complex subunit F [Halobacteria archaeon]|nr:monovalent cation/H+ antiporter complex subunit F [Halobacteria archaeon]